MSANALQMSRASLARDFYGGHQYTVSALAFCVILLRPCSPAAFASLAFDDTPRPGGHQSSPLATIA
jgi:hypothetical protein